MEQNIIGLAIISAVVGVVMVGVLVKAVHQRGGMRDDSDETVRHRMHVDLFAMGTERDEEVDTLSGRKGAPAVYDVFLKRTSEIAAAEKLQPLSAMLLKPGPKVGLTAGKRNGERRYSSARDYYRYRHYLSLLTDLEARGPAVPGESQSETKADKDRLEMATIIAMPCCGEPTGFPDVMVGSREFDWSHGAPECWSTRPMPT